MKNKHVGYLVIGIAIIFLFIVLSFNQALDSVVDTSCGHGTECPMNAKFKTQQIISYSLMGLLVLVGLFMMFFMKDEKQVIKEIHKEVVKENGLNEEERKEKLNNLDEEERSIMNIVLREDGSVYQSDLIKETGISKVKVSRILDRLEGKGLIERKRRGMTNVVVMK